MHLTIHNTLLAWCFLVTHKIMLFLRTDSKYQVVLGGTGLESSHMEGFGRTENSRLAWAAEWF